MTVTRKKLTDLIKEKTGFNTAECDKLVEQLFETIAETLENGETVKISGFGNFKVREKRARNGRNPQTGEPIEISARRVVTFKPSHILREKLGGTPD